MSWCHGCSLRESNECHKRLLLLPRNLYAVAYVTRLPVPSAANIVAPRAIKKWALRVLRGYLHLHCTVGQCKRSARWDREQVAAREKITRENSRKVIECGVLVVVSTRILWAARLSMFSSRRGESSLLAVEISFSRHYPRCVDYRQGR